MKKKNFWLIIAMALALLNFVTCENQIMETWWGMKEQRDVYDYVAIIKDTPYLVFETIVEERTIYQEIIIYYPEYIDRPLPPEILLQHIDIKSIEFIIFSGDQTEYNWPAAGGAVSNLTEQEQLTNNKILKDVWEALKTNDGGDDYPEKYFLILHGHANPLSGTASEAAELEKISNARATAVRNAIGHGYNGGTMPISAVPGVNPSPNITNYIMPQTHDLSDRITTRGYGGDKNIASSNSLTYAGLNRRVEAILFTITEVPNPARVRTAPSGIGK